METILIVLGLALVALTVYAVAATRKNAALIERATKAEAQLEAAMQNAQNQELLKTQFKLLAHDIFGEHSRNFKETNQESLDVLLKPFRESITDFRLRVEKIHETNTGQQGELRNELKNLMELNRRITTETTNLTNALKGNSKTQGDWGEMILESILDNSSLIRGVHYDTQHNLKDEAGNDLRPDVVLYLPEGKRIVIDSKVSLTAFAQYIGAEQETTRRQHLAAHVESVRNHVKELGRKEYHRLLDSPDFVIMFVPNEPAFLAALHSDNAIWQDAYEKKVIVSSPTNLFALLKLVDDLWKRNDQNRNTMAILECAAKLYDQVAMFNDSLVGVGKSLDTARDKYADAFKRLHDGNNNIDRLGSRLHELGLKTSKQIEKGSEKGDA